MNSVHTRPPVAPSPASIGIVFASGMLSTAVHYAHNFAYAADYPPVPFFPTALAYQVGIAVFWPALTLLGAWAVLQYRRGNVAAAVPALAAWSLLGLTSVGHFLGGVPDIPAFAMVTISTDFATGLLMLVLVGQARARLRAAGVDGVQRAGGIA